MRVSPRGAHGSFRGNTISNRSRRPATVVDAPAGSKLGSDLEMARKRSLNILSFSPFPPDISSSHPLWVYFVSLFFSHSSHLPAASLSPQHARFSVPVALQRKFNIGLFGVSKDSIRRSSGHYAKTNISCWGQEQQTLPHYPTVLICAPLVSSPCSLASESFCLVNLCRTSLVAVKLRKCGTFWRSGMKRRLFVCFWNFFVF